MPRDTYIQTIERLNLQPELVAMHAEHEWRFEEVGYTAAMRAFDGKGFATRTVLCANDRLATGVIAPAFQRGFRAFSD